MPARVSGLQAELKGTAKEIADLRSQLAVAKSQVCDSVMISVTAGMPRRARNCAASWRSPCHGCVISGTIGPPRKSLAPEDAHLPPPPGRLSCPRPYCCPAV